MSFRALAIMSVYQEADILAWTLKHLHEQGIGIHVVDNWSSDGSEKIAHSFPLVGFEKFPADGPPKLFMCRAIQRRIDEIAAASDADWISYHDADEVRRSPRFGERMIDAFQRIQAEGFNTINHQVYHFYPTDDNYSGDPENHFRYYAQDRSFGPNFHMKAWRNQQRLLGLGEWGAGGGHTLRFPGMRVCPVPFVIKHYPVRSQAHGEAKVEDRLKRFDPVERAHKWHVQYDGMESPYNFLKDPATLLYWADPLKVPPVKVSVSAPEPKATMPMAEMKPAPPKSPEFVVVILSKNADNLIPCLQSISQNEPTLTPDRIIIVDDGLVLTEDEKKASRCLYIQGAKPFIFARNANLGIKATDANCLILLNDDTLLRTLHGLSKIATLAADHMEFGIVAAATNVTGQPLQTPMAQGLREVPWLPFICVAIPRRTLNVVGLLDERYAIDYGVEDLDYCERTLRAGLKLGVYDYCFVDHGSLHSTFRGDPRTPATSTRNAQLFQEKFGYGMRDRARAAIQVW